MTTFSAKIGSVHGHTVYACHDESSVWVRVERTAASEDFSPERANRLAKLLEEAAAAADGTMNAAPSAPLN